MKLNVTFKATDKISPKIRKLKRRAFFVRIKIDFLKWLKNTFKKSKSNKSKTDVTAKKISRHFSTINQRLKVRYTAMLINVMSLKSHGSIYANKTLLVYECKNCNSTTVAKNINVGITPRNLACECGQLQILNKEKVCPALEIAASHVFYRPSFNDFEKFYDEGKLDSIQKVLDGHLLLRKNE